MQMTNYEYNLLFLFKICADCGSFSKASIELNVKQPAISYSIKKLEEYLNVKLFNRTKYGIVLTDEGTILYDYVKEANNNIISGLNILEELKEKEIKILNIGVALNIGVVYLSDVLEKFIKLFPNIKVIVITKPEDEMMKDLQEKKLDIVIFNSSKNVSYNGLKVKKINNQEVLCVGNKKYKDLIEENPKTEVVVPLLLPNGNTVLGKNLQTKLKNKNVIFKNIINCQSSILAKEFLIKGLGLGYINGEIVKKDIEDGKLYAFDDDTNLNMYSMNLATQSKNNNVAIQEFKKLFISEVTK